MTDALPPPRHARDLLRAYGLSPKRSFSQNFLVQAGAIDRIADAAAELGDELVELGPGLGALTHALLERGCRVLAVELDRDMIRVLQGELGAHPALEIREGDAAELDLGTYAEERGAKLVVTGNLPYQATGAILRQVLGHREALRGAVLMVQREVRDRLVAPPGTKEYGALSVFVQAGFEVDTVCKLRPGSFHPPPKVESAVVRLRPKPSPSAEETPRFRALVRAAFQMRRKTLRNALKTLDEDERWARAAEIEGIDLSRRGETLSVREFGALAERCDTLE